MSQPTRPKLFKYRHFELEMILLCMRWYLRYSLSYQELEEMMAERGLSFQLAEVVATLPVQVPHVFKDPHCCGCWGSRVGDQGSGLVLRAVMKSGNRSREKSLPRQMRGRLFSADLTGCYFAGQVGVLSLISYSARSSAVRSRQSLPQSQIRLSL